MFTLESLRKPERELHWIALGVLLGMAILLGKLWHTQVVSRKKYQESLQVQAVRTVPMLPTRGRILDAHGRLLAENQPRYDVKLYLEDIRPLFYHEYTNTTKRVWAEMNPGAKLDRATRLSLEAEARYSVVSNLVMQASAAVGDPKILRPDRFAEHYAKKLSLPMPVLEQLKPMEVSQFLERASHLPGLDLEVAPVRVYPYGRSAAHMIGYIGRAELQTDDEEFRFSYPIPGYAGRTGLERAFDPQLRGTPGVKALLVNNIGYRQSENIRTEPESGGDLHLTIDADIQIAADAALRSTGEATQGAIVVMDVRNGDILAMASAPSYDLNEFVNGISHEAWAKLNDAKLSPQLNRATAGQYPPGSVFKIIVGLAALERGFDPKEQFASKGYYQLTPRARPIDDTAGAGLFDFRRGFLKSSNPYFIHRGLQLGLDPILAMGKQFHLGERTEFLSRHDIVGAQEVAGYFPDPSTRLKRIGLPWLDGDTANLSIGQGEILVTPLQIAVMISAVANRGIVYTPRLVSAIVPQDGDEPVIEHTPAGVVRSRVNVSSRTWDILHEAMVADVEDAEGSGKNAFLPGMRICGKTGTAELGFTNEAGHSKVTWFAAFAPYESPRYAVVVVNEGGASGGATCAPKAKKVFEALLKREQNPLPKIAPRNLAGLNVTP